jgi:hypothetical protein
MPSSEDRVKSGIGFGNTCALELGTLPWRAASFFGAQFGPTAACRTKIG